MDIRKLFTDHRYEVEASPGFDGHVELLIRKGDVRLLKMALPLGHDLKAFAAGVLVGRGIDPVSQADRVQP